jgi:glutaredoxin 3
MAERKWIEIYSAGCLICREAEKAVRRIAGGNHDIEVHDMRQAHIAGQASRHGIRSVPAVMIDGHVAACCAGRGVDEAVLRSELA